MKRFIWWNIVTRFDIPHIFILNNGLQFDSKAFQRYYCEIGIRKNYSTPAYPQGIGQAEAINKVIVNGLKKMVDEAKGKWVDELPHSLWAYRTTQRRSTSKTHFSLTYSSEAIISLETGFSMMRIDQFDDNRNEQLLSVILDLIEEIRKIAIVKLVHYQQKLEQGYDKGIKARAFVPRDLVLMKVIGNMKNPA